MRTTTHKTVILPSTKLLAIAVVSLLLHGVTLGQLPRHGTIEGGTYVDQRFGMRYTFPKDLEVQTSLNGRPVGTGERQGSSEFLFNAMEKPNGHVRRGIFITADPVGTFGATESSGFLKSMIEKTLAPQDAVDVTTVIIAGHPFSESRVGGRFGGTGQLEFSGAQLATVCNGYFLAFSFSGTSPDDVTQLLHSMDHMELKCSAPSK